MGGNAMKHIGVQVYRMDKSQYNQIMLTVYNKLNTLFPDAGCVVIQSYSDKQTFGDGDVLLCTETLPENWIELVKDDFASDGVVCNGDCVSFEYARMQIDIIKTTRKDIAMTRTYYDYNDLGGLMGVVASKMGYKYGFLGLFKTVRSTVNKFDNLFVSNNARKIFDFLGYDFDRYCVGFKTLEEIFEYVASGKYFSKEIFLLENRNNEKRSRDSKRITYNHFLTWCKKTKPTDNYVWSPYFAGATNPERDKEYLYFLEEGFTKFLEFKPLYDESVCNFNLNKEFRVKWNGDLVYFLTRLQGQELGNFMKYCHQIHQQLNGGSFTEWVCDTGKEEIAKFILNCYSTSPFKK